MNFDEKIKEIEQIVQELSEDLPMENAVDKYQKGVVLVKECLMNLEQSKGEVYKVKQELDKYIEERMK